VGPSWRAVSERYYDNPDAEALLIEKVKKGGKGNWTEVTGGVPMPPYSPRVRDADIQTLVRFILDIAGNSGPVGSTFLSVDAPPVYIQSNQDETLDFYFLSYPQRTYAVGINAAKGLVDVSVQSAGVADTSTVAEQTNVAGEAALEFEAAANKHTVSVHAVKDSGFYIDVSDVTVEQAPTDTLDLAKHSGCLACHAVDKKVVGPSWQAVSERYLNDPNAEAFLVEKVKKGGNGSWTEVTGGAPMPPYSPRVSDENIAVLVRYILNIAQ
jgi:cytochrome c